MQAAIRTRYGPPDVVRITRVDRPVPKDHELLVRIHATTVNRTGHAHATQLLSAGVHVKAVSERLGHSSTSFTMDTYSAVIPSMGRTAADAADQLFG